MREAGMLKELLEERRKRRCEENLHGFFLQAWKVLEPATELIDSWHYELICEYLELITRGKFRERYPDKQGLIINVPSRTGKSLLVSAIWPSWSWILRPSLKFLC